MSGAMDHVPCLGTVGEAALKLVELLVGRLNQVDPYPKFSD